MFASVSSVLLSKTGPIGLELIRQLFRSKDKVGPVTRFVTTYPSEASQWVGVAPDAREPLSAQQLAKLLDRSPETLVELARRLGVSEDEVVRIADRALYQAVQMAAPDGMRVSPREAKRLDEDLGSAIRHRSPEAR